MTRTEGSTVKNESSKPRPHPLARKALAAIEPYVPGRSAEDVRREYGLATVAKLGSNENPLGVSPKIRDALLAAIDGVVTEGCLIAVSDVTVVKYVAHSAKPDPAPAS